MSARIIYVCTNFHTFPPFFAENIIKYNVPRGETREPDIDLEDISYDGILDGNYMKGGLGQLVDGLYGDDDYQKQLQGENSGKATLCLAPTLTFHRIT